MSNQGQGGSNAVGINALQNLVIALNKLVQVMGTSFYTSPAFNGTATFENLSASGYIKTDPTTVSLLPLATTVGAGARALVTDATATTFASNVAGGGANTVPVYSDGTNWKIG